jgi:signal transduction histidine kinase/AraC-like DNA-binding protein/ABC-type sugar transport system substrate-binding protein
MTRTIRIGSDINPADPYWVQVQESALERAQGLGVELISLRLFEYPDTPASSDQEIALIEELQALELDALIAGALPLSMVRHIPAAGIPLILLGETELHHPLLISASGYYAIAQMAGTYLAERIGQRGTVLIVGGHMPVGWQDDGAQRLAGLRQTLGAFPAINVLHIPSLWSYDDDLIARHLTAALQMIGSSLDAIIGLSDGLALAAADAALALGLIQAQTLIVGIGGTPSALAKIMDGSMHATLEIRTDLLGCQAVELAYQVACRQPAPPHLAFQARLVTAANVVSIAASKLVAIANMPSRLVDARRRQRRERLVQLETSLAINQRIGTILDSRQLSVEIAEMIRMNYGYDHVQIFSWSEEERCLVLNLPEVSHPERLLPLDQAGLVGQALERNEPIVIPDTRHSSRFAPDPLWPETRTRVILPIRLGPQVIGVLDLHSRRPQLRTSEELIGLQTLADQLGIAIHNARLYGEALRAQAEAEKADRLKTRLLANVSHELRTPLHVILSANAPVLHDAGRIERPAELIQRNAEHLQRLINDLLDLSRAEIGELDLVLEWLDPRPLLMFVFNSLATSQAPDTPVSWQIQIPDRLPWIQADPVRLRQILFNLLSNAAKFTAEGQIILGAEVRPPHLHLWVTDTGVGIPLEQQQQIFEPFTIAESRQRRHTGVGLGLAITRRLVALHRGSISVESEVQRGSTFLVLLPLPRLDTRQSYAAISTGLPLLAILSASATIPPEVQAFAEQQGLTIRLLDRARHIEQLLDDGCPVAFAWDMAGAIHEDWSIIQSLCARSPLAQVPFLLYSNSSVAGLTQVLPKPSSGLTLQAMIESLRPLSGSGSVLLVDDDPDTLSAYRAIVQAALPQHVIRTATDGVVAIKALQTAAPSLVILDLNMPGLDGFDVLDWLRAYPATRAVPVLIVSGRALSIEDVQRMEQHARVTLHSKGLLTEPEIANAIERALGTRFLHTPPTSALVKRTLVYLHQHFARTVSRGEIAHTLGTTEDYLSRIFHQELGLSPWQYLKRLRIHYAKARLRESSESITAIALQTGFDDPAYFSRIFHQEVGCSPSAYRQRPER